MQQARRGIKSFAQHGGKLYYRVGGNYLVWKTTKRVLVSCYGLCRGWEEMLTWPDAAEGATDLILY